MLKTFKLFITAIKLLLQLPLLHHEYLRQYRIIYVPIETKKYIKTVL